jgi:hypothetical protein
MEWSSPKEEEEESESSEALGRMPSAWWSIAGNEELSFKFSLLLYFWEEFTQGHRNIVIQPSD